ncbi:MAG: hypothetical protein ABI178_14055 [Rhodanobacter sp.]
MACTSNVDEHTEAIEAQIAVHCKEEHYFQPSKAFIEQANTTDPDIRQKFGVTNFPDCFKEYADMLTWSTPYTAPASSCVACSLRSRKGSLSAM